MTDTDATIPGRPRAANTAAYSVGNSLRTVSITLRNVENISAMSSFAIHFIGNNENNIFDGGTVADNFRGNGGDDVFVVGTSMGDVFEDFSNAEGNNDKLDFRKTFPGKNVSNLAFRKSSNDLVVTHPDAVRTTILRNAFETVLADYQYTARGRLVTDFYFSTNGIDASKFFIFTNDPGD